MGGLPEQCGCRNDGLQAGAVWECSRLGCVLESCLHSLRTVKREKDGMEEEHINL